MNTSDGVTSRTNVNLEGGEEKHTYAGGDEHVLTT